MSSSPLNNCVISQRSPLFWCRHQYINKWRSSLYSYPRRSKAPQGYSKAPPKADCTAPQGWIKNPSRLILRSLKANSKDLSLCSSAIESAIWLPPNPQAKQDNEDSVPTSLMVENSDLCLFTKVVIWWFSNFLNLVVACISLLLYKLVKCFILWIFKVLGSIVFLKGSLRGKT